MSIFNVIGMIPKGGKYAKSVVNFVRKAPEHWPKFKEAIKQIDDLLKIGKLKLDGKQRTIFETNKNILKNHEKVEAQVFKNPPYKSTEDAFKGWTPTLVERSKSRDIYQELVPPPSKYTKEMEVIDEELDALVFGGEKYRRWADAEKAKLFKKLQADMKKLIDATKKDDVSTLSLSQIKKKSHDLQRRIREIKDNPNIKGTVDAGPKHDMIKILSDSERPALTKARHDLIRKNSKLKYGKKFPVLDPENQSFIVIGLDEFGHPLKMSRFTGKFTATYEGSTKTGDLTRNKATQWWDKWDAKKNQIRKEGEEVWHETVDRDGKVIMSNPDYKIPQTGNMELQTELYSDLSTSDLAKKGYDLKQIDMIVKGRLARKYLEAQEAAEPNLDIYQKLHERTETSAIPEILEDLYLRSDDIYKMSIKEWTKKIPEYFAEGGRIGFKRGLTSAPWLRGKSGSGNIKAWRGSEGWKEAQKLAKKFNLKGKTQTTGIFAAILAAQEAGVIGMDETLKMLGKQETDIYKVSDFYRMWKNFQAMKEALKRNKARKTRGGPEMQEDYYSGYYKEQMPPLNWHPIHPGDEEILSSDLEMRDYVYPPKEPKEEKEEIDFNILDAFKNDPTWLKIKKWLEERKGHATGGISNLFRKRQGYRSGKTVELVTKLPEFLKFVERLLIKASNEIRQGIGKWKGLDTAQKVTQHDNLTKLATEFQKTKKFDKSFNEYFGIDAEKAFIEAQTKVKTDAARLKLSYADKDKRLIPEGMDKDVIDDAIRTGNAQRGKIWKSSEGETEGIAMGFNKTELKELDKAMVKATALSDAMKKMGFNVASANDTVKFDKLVSEGMIGFSKEMKEQIIRAKYGDVVNKELLNQMLVDTNPQRLSEVMGTIDEGILMHQKGMGTDEIITTLKDSFKRRPNVEGGLIPGYATGGVSNLFRSR